MRDAGDVTGAGDSGQLPGKVRGQLPVCEDGGLAAGGHPGGLRLPGVG